MDPLLFEFLDNDPQFGIFAGELLDVDLSHGRMWTSTQVISPDQLHLADLLAEHVVRLITPSQSAVRGIHHPAFPVRLVA